MIEESEEIDLEAANKRFEKLDKIFSNKVLLIHGKLKPQEKENVMDKNQDIKLPECYIWLSQNQLIDLIHKQKIDIEARLLFGIINFKETI